MDPPIAGILLTVSYDLRVSNSHNLLPFETECADKIPSSDPANMTSFVTDNIGVSLSINNLLDETPPIVGDVLSNGYGNTMGGFYDNLGMYWNLRVDMVF